MVAGRDQFTRSKDSGPLVELRGVDVVFNRHPVLRDIDLQIPRGQTLSIIGESGCGKTVLLKTIIGLVRPARGEMLFDGKVDKPWGKTPRSNKLIFIGRNLDREALTEGFKSCLA